MLSTINVVDFFPDVSIIEFKTSKVVSSQQQLPWKQILDVLN